MRPPTLDLLLIQALKVNITPEYTLNTCGICNNKPLKGESAGGGGEGGLGHYCETTVAYVRPWFTYNMQICQKIFRPVEIACISIYFLFLFFVCLGPLLNPLIVYCATQQELQKWLYHLEKQIQLNGGNLDSLPVTEVCLRPKSSILCAHPYSG